MTYIIMAQGTGDRWDITLASTGQRLEPHKQLVLVGTRPIIKRTVEQLMRFAQELPTVICWQAIADKLPGMKAFGYREPVNSLLYGMLRTEGLWMGRMTFLLGDVVYSNAAMKSIVEDKRPIVFFGRFGPNKITGKVASELFGISFDESEYDLIEQTMRAIIRDKDAPEKLWGLSYKLAKVVELKTGEREAEDTGLLLLFDDYTDDCDSPQEFNEFYPALHEAAKMDDEQWKH